MIYKIVVDKQPMTNPSGEKKEYEIDIDELHFKRDVYDSLVITHDEDYVMRRLELGEYNVLTELNPPIKEPLPDLNIKLFEGDNYIYLYDMEGNKIVAQYLVKNEFNELYITQSEMNSAIEQSAKTIELSVNGKIKRVDGDIKDLSANLELKVDKNDNDQVVSMINASADEITLKSNRLIIDSTNFKLNSAGNITATGGNIGGFNLNSTSFSKNVKGIYDYNGYDLIASAACVMDWIYQDAILADVLDANNDGRLDSADFLSIIRHINNTIPSTKEVSGVFEINSTNPKNCVSIKKGNEVVVSLGLGGISTNLLTTRNIICGKKDIKKISGDNGFKGISINGEEGQIFCIGEGSSSTVIDYTGIITPSFQVAGAGYCMYGTATDHIYKCNWDGSSLHFYVDNTDIGNISDKRLKTDIKNVDEDLIKAIGELDYKQFKKDNRNGLISVGVIAQDLIEVLKKYNKNAKDYELLQEFEYNLDEKTLYYKIDYEQFLLLRMMAKEQEIKELQEKDKQKDEILANLIERLEKLEKEANNGQD